MIAVWTEAAICEAALAVSRSSDGLSFGLRCVSSAIAFAPMQGDYRCKARMSFVRSVSDRVCALLSTYSSSVSKKHRDYKRVSNRSDNGHAAVMAPTNEMNSRRLIRSPRRQWQERLGS
jgi:hypothetical protein